MLRINFSAFFRKVESISYLKNDIKYDLYPIKNCVNIFLCWTMCFVCLPLGLRMLLYIFRDYSHLHSSFFQNQTYRGKHYSIPFSAFLILTARYSFVGKSILKRPLKLPTFSTVMFHVSIMSTVYILLSSI